MTDDNKRDDQKRNDDQDRKRLSDEELKDVTGGGGEKRVSGLIDEIKEGDSV